MMNATWDADWAAGLGADDALRGQGADPSRVRSRSPLLTGIAERAARDGAALLEPSVSQRILAVCVRRPGAIVLEGGAALTGPLVARRFSTSRRVAVLVATIGPSLEGRVERFFARDLPYAMALDGFGSIAVEKLARAACRALADGVRRDGLELTAPVSPGMEGWPLGEGQEAICRLLPEACIRRTPLGFLVPRKSLSLAIGIGTAPTSLEQAEPCDDCTARPRCRHRSGHGAAL